MPGRSRIWLSLLLACLSMLFLGHLAGPQDQPSPDGAPGSDCADVSARSDEPWEFVGPLAEIELSHTLRPNESIHSSLKRYGVDEASIAELASAMSRVFDSRSRCRPGDRYAVTLGVDGAIQRFGYLPAQTPERQFVAEREAAGLRARVVDLPLETRVCVVEFVIEDNLANAVIAAGETAALTDMLADEIFASAIDFAREPRRGDRVAVVLEKLAQDSTFVRYGRVLLARYAGQATSRLGVRFESGPGQVAYYDENGVCLARRFMLYALPYRRITSSFSQRRLHPVLNRVRPHLGTDFGAPAGTPVWATAHGVVVDAGWKGGLGKAVVVQHPGGYVTRYGHLSGILVQPGQRVRQKQVIGRVGATGLATGPHLHYEIIKNGRHLNPETINRGTSGESLPAGAMAAFRAQRDALLEMLRAHQAAAPELSVAAAATAAGEPPADL